MNDSPPTDQIALDSALTKLRECVAASNRRRDGGDPHFFVNIYADQAAALLAAGFAPEPDGSQAPIVCVTVEERGTTVASGGTLPNYVITRSKMYNPGLPPGDHDLYCVPHPGKAGDEWPSHDEAQRRVGVMALKAAGEHAERVVELESERVAVVLMLESTAESLESGDDPIKAVSQLRLYARELRGATPAVCNAETKDGG